MSSPSTATQTPARPRRTLLVVLLTALVASGLLLAPPSAEAARYTPKPGVTFNYPLSKDVGERRAIVGKVLQSVGGAPKGSQIRFASWNIRGGAVVDALIAAHERGVSVRVILDKKNAYRGNLNREVNRLQAELKRHGNGKRSPALKSGLRKCKASCRGKTGFAHSKFFVFSKVGKARMVVINSSSNATDLAAGNQWNDAFTMVGDQTMYDAFATEFDQMYADQPIQQSFVTATSGSKTVDFYPYHGVGTDEDPVVGVLDQVGCKGATNETSGRTRIQISQTSWFGERGIAIAQKLRQLKGEGCNIKVIYAVGGGEVVRLLRRSGIPLRHIVQDFNRDGVYDRYLHQKVMTIRGVYGTDTGAFMTMNGSSNWTPLSLLSDEAVMLIDSKEILKQYNSYIDALFRHPPPNPGRGVKAKPAADRTAAERAAARDNPLLLPQYAQVQVD